MKTDKLLSGEGRKSHESYGVLGISRQSHHPAVPLFGSSIKHGNIISITVKEADVTRDFQRDWVHGGKTLLEINMSATQFADAITSLNVGDGVPVTIKYVKGDEWDKDKRQFRDPPPETDFKKRAQGELKAEMEELGERLEALSKEAKLVLETKGPIKAVDKQNIIHSINALIREVRSNIPFAHECFAESVERTVVEAKGEIDATYQTIRERLGDQALLDHKNSIEVPVLNENKETK